MDAHHAIPLSVLDLAVVGHGATTAAALADTTMLAQRAEALGYVGDEGEGKQITDFIHPEDLPKAVSYTHLTLPTNREV